MTTKVTVEPAGHRIQISITDHSSSKFATDNSTTKTYTSSSTKVILEPGSAPWVDYVHGNKYITIREIADGETDDDAEATEDSND